MEIRDRRVSIRFSPGEFINLQTMAKGLQIPVSTLIRDRMVKGTIQVFSFSNDRALQTYFLSFSQLKNGLSALHGQLQQTSHVLEERQEAEPTLLQEIARILQRIDESVEDFQFFIRNDLFRSIQELKQIQANEYVYDLQDDDTIEPVLDELDLQRDNVEDRQDQNDSTREDRERLSEEERSILGDDPSREELELVRTYLRKQHDG